jgi:hypothetical protein
MSMSALDQNGNYKDIVGQLRDVAKIETGVLYSRRLMLNQAADEIAKLRAALEEIAKTNQIREFMGDDASDGYGSEGWVMRDGQYAKISRAALSAPEGDL